MTMVNLLAGLTWDPQLRGAVIVLTAISILCGSVYLLLATNMGAKIGFLLAAAGLTGWMTVMGVVWVAYGIGLKGDDPHWEVVEVLTGDINRTTVDALGDFPAGWEQMRPGHAILGDAQAAADHVLAPAAGGEGGEEAGPEFDPVFRSVTDYALVAAWRTGGEDYFPPGIEHPRGIFHKPHYAVIQVAPIANIPSFGGTPAPPEPDLAQPVTHVIMLRNLGSKRFPSFVMTISLGILFAVICNSLHRRDKQIWAEREAAKAAAAAPTPEKVGAGAR
ncbi:MAG: hypothetical protein ACRD0D_12645 [Acidimicrobiales bacterium]